MESFNLLPFSLNQRRLEEKILDLFPSLTIILHFLILETRLISCY